MPWIENHEKLNLNSDRTIIADRHLLPTNFVDIFDSKITWEELESALTHCEINKASGKASIPSQFYKLLPQNWKLSIYLLLIFGTFNAVTDTWSTSLVTVLYKIRDTLRTR